jgi:hypothetical protein
LKVKEIFHTYVKLKRAGVAILVVSDKIALNAKKLETKKDIIQ